MINKVIINRPPDLIKDKIEYNKVKGIEYSVIKGKDRSAMGKLLAFYKKNNPDSLTDKVLSEMQEFFSAVLHFDYKNQFLNNITISKLLSSINEYKQCYLTKPESFPQRNHHSQLTPLANILHKIR